MIDSGVPMPMLARLPVPSRRILMIALTRLVTSMFSAANRARSEDTRNG